MEQNLNIKSGERPGSALPETGEALERLVERLIEERLELRRSSEARAANEADAGEGEHPADAGEDERRREREAELNRREEELRRRELRAHAAGLFIERGLPKELAQFTDCGDEAACERSVDALEELFREGVRRAVEARLNETRLSAAHLPRSVEAPQSGLVRRMRAAAGLGAD